MCHVSPGDLCQDSLCEICPRNGAFNWNPLHAAPHRATPPPERAFREISLCMFPLEKLGGATSRQPPTTKNRLDAHHTKPQHTTPHHTRTQIPASQARMLADWRAWGVPSFRDLIRELAQQFEISAGFRTQFHTVQNTFGHSEIAMLSHGRNWTCLPCRMSLLRYLFSRSSTLRHRAVLWI